MLKLNKLELIEAGAILFGNQMLEGAQFLDRLQLTELKRAYRQKSLQTHPDLFVHLGSARQQTYAELFQEVREAYEKLCGYLKLRAQLPDRVYPTSSSPCYNNVQSTPRPADSRPKAAPPVETTGAAVAPESSLQDVEMQLHPWRLRTGELLFYSGVISWRMLIGAILWQSRQRERLGEIACRWGWLTEELLWDLMLDRQAGERVGGILLRHRIVTPFQLKMLLIHQQHHQPPIGSYFLENGRLSEEELMSFLEYLSQRNHRFDRRDSIIPPQPAANNL